MTKNLKTSTPPLLDVHRCHRFTRWIAPVARGIVARPLDQTSIPRHKTRHENGYLHYLPEDYSLAQSWPGRFRLPNVQDAKRPGLPVVVFFCICILGE
jgi:hypothetical protein